MLRWIATAAVGLQLATVVFGQSLTAEQKALVDAARAKYYNLESRGFASASCTVNFDLRTIPSLPSEDPASDRKVIEKTIFSLTLGGTEGTPIKVKLQYPKEATEKALDRAAGLASALRLLVQRTFQTWGKKGLHGPIPTDDSQIDSVTPSDGGYTILTGDQDDPLRIELDKNLLVAQIVSEDGKIDERPTYTSTIDGLVYVGNVVIDSSNPNNKITARYELGSQIVNGFRLPSTIRLQVARNIDVRFSLNNCIVRKDLPPRSTPEEER